MWDWGGANGFDVDTGSTQGNHFQYAYKLEWGGGEEHCICTCIAVTALLYHYTELYKLLSN